MPKILYNIVKQGWPYALAFYFANKLTEVFVIIRSDDIMIKLQNLERALPVAFANPLPSMRQQALIGGLVAVFAVFFIIQNIRDKKKKLREGIEHGSAKWGTKEELEPLVDPDFSKNIILSETERLRMTPMPKGMWQRACNKNVLVVGGSGSGKTSSFLKAQLADGEKPAAFLFEKAASEGIQERTLRSAKQALAVPSYRRDKKWFWGVLPQAEGNENE